MDLSLEVLSHPRVQGSMQAFAGLAEASAGGLATLGSGGLAAPIGWPVLVHGLDQFITGMSTSITGKHRATLTEQLLQTTGLPSKWASFTNDVLTIGGTMGGSAIVRASRLGAFPIFKLPSKTVTNLSEGFQETKGAIRLWPSITKSTQLINGIEYVPHALERMSPRGLIHKGTEMVSRGVPPSVVENALKFGTKVHGNTSNEIVHIFENVRVVTNPEGTRVITVITTGR